MSFFVFGISHKECPVEVRERLHFSSKKLAEAYAQAKTSTALSELVILSTCNRVEFYGFSEAMLAAEDAIFDLIEKTHGLQRADYVSYVYRFEGKGAIRQLFRVASGLDSLVVGENEILGQVREAFRAANEAGSVHSLVYRLMEKALKLGKEVRTQTKINEGAVSIPTVAVELAEKIFGQLAGQKIMVLGTGEMSEKTLRALGEDGARALYVVSRSREKGEPLADLYEAQWISLEEWEKYLAEVDILITSTSAPHPIVKYDLVKRVMEARARRPLFIVDIAVPRDVEPQAYSIDDVYLYNIDDLKGVSAANLSRRSREVKAAEALVDQAVLDYQSWLEQLKARPTLERFEEFLNETLEKELKPLFRRLGQEEKLSEETIQKLRAKLLHPPHEKIKEASKNGGVTRYLEALQSLFHLDKK